MEILIVEPNPDDEALTRRVLEREGLADRAAIARTSAETLARLESGPHPVAIFIDLGSPYHMGLELLARLRAGERTRNIPVVVMVGGSYEREVLGKWIGPAAVVERPVALEAFRFAIAGSNVPRR